MLSLKSTKLYFFSILEIIISNLKIFYFKSNYYNKKLENFLPSRIYYYPNSYLISSLASSNSNKYKISDLQIKNIWEFDEKNNSEYDNLHSFLWLNKLDRKSNKLIIQKIISNWINFFFNFNQKSWEILILSKRIIAWGSNTDIIFEESDNEYKEKFFLSLTKQINFLVKNVKKVPSNSKRLIADSAIILSGLIFKEHYSNVKLGLKDVEKLILTYFDISGFPKSRNPEEVITCIKYFILIREWLKEANEPIPEFINEIISKCGNVYNFLSNSKKTIPLFNGSTEINYDNFDKYLKVLNYKFKNSNNENGGLVKIKKNKFELFFDVGEPPNNNFSENYQAGPLSFELIYNSEKIFCNCGYGKNISKKIAILSRKTAAHTTLYINNNSPVTFQKNELINKIYGNSINDTFKIKEKNFLDNKNETHIIASHNGYEKKYGYIHKRCLTISKKEDKIVGVDELKKTKKFNNIINYYIRFHVYPGLKIVKTIGSSILIKVKNGDGWLFKSDDNKIEIEKDIFFGNKRIVNSECILIYGETDKDKIVVNWKIEKLI